MRTALVTGVTGFLGGHLARRLLEGGWSVRALVRGDARGRGLPEGVVPVAGDLTRPSILGGVTAGVDVVFHAACATSATFASGARPERLFTLVNRDGTEAIARETIRTGARFVHVSSTAAMGLGGAADGEAVDEDSPLLPTTPYGRSKKEAEEVLTSLARGSGLDAVIVRPCMIAGPGKRGGEVRQLVRLAGLGILPVMEGTEGSIKPIVFVDDVVSALLLAADRGVRGRAYLVHDGVDHTLMEIVLAAGRAAGQDRPFRRLPIRPLAITASLVDAVSRLVPSWSPPITRARIDLLASSRRISIRRAREELGYEPRITDVEEMLRQSV